MNCLHRTVAWVFLALWLPVTNHCLLENFTAFHFLACCPHHAAPHQDHDCDEDGCAVVESGLYMVPVHPEAVSPPSPVPALIALCPVVESLVPTGVEWLPRPFPPELGTRWQFDWRAAPRARAPSRRV